MAAHCNKHQQSSNISHKPKTLKDLVGVTKVH